MISKLIHPLTSWEFMASAIDVAQRIVYIEIEISYLVLLWFSSNLYFVNLMWKDLVIPSEIFQFEFNDIFIQLVQPAKFQLKILRIPSKWLMKEKNFPSKWVHHIQHVIFKNIDPYLNNFILLRKHRPIEEESPSIPLRINLIKRKFIFSVNHLLTISSYKFDYTIYLKWLLSNI